MNLLEVKNLNKVFHLSNGEKIDILKNVNFIIKSKKSYAIVGKSGAGKSSFINILGLIDNEYSGSVYYEENLINHDLKVRSQLLKQDISIIYQFYHLLQEFTVIENVMFPLILLNKKINEARSIAKEILSDLNLADKEHFLINQLSGGQQQRVCIARALVKSPKLILADEPTGNLDTDNSDVVENIIFSQCKKRNISLVLVTHSDDLARKCQEVYRVVNKGLHFDGSNSI